MSDTQGSVAPVVTDYPNFLESAHDLRILLKDLKKESKGAINTLVTLMEKPEVDDKVKLQAAVKLLEHYAAVANQANTLHLQQLIAAARSNGPKQLTESQKQQMPRLDFNTIQEIS